MNTTAVFLEPVNRMDTRQLQPMPDSSEAAWDRWMLDVGGADFLSWRARCQPSAPAPDVARPAGTVASED
jgi:hypothetical protein